MLCDAHIHFIPEKLADYTAFYKGIWTEKNMLYEYLDKFNIAKALLVYPSTDAHLKLKAFSRICDIYNAELETIIKENPKITGAAIIDLDNFSTIAKQVNILREKGFGAISIASSHNGKFLIQELLPLFTAAEEHNLPIFVHPQTINPIGFERVKDPLLMPVLEYSFDTSMFMGLLMMEEIFQKYQVRFIFSSLAGIIPFLKDRFDRVYTMLRKREMVKDLGKLPSEILRHVYVDTSGASLENIRLAMNLFGEDKLLWGSDYPVCVDIVQNLNMLDELGESVKEKIISKNFVSIFSRNTNDERRTAK